MITRIGYPYTVYTSFCDDVIIAGKIPCYSSINYIRLLFNFIFYLIVVLVIFFIVIRIKKILRPELAMNKKSSEIQNKFLGWLITIIGGMGILWGIGGIYTKSDCIKAYGKYFCGDFPYETAIVFFMILVTTGILILRKLKKNKILQ